MPTTRSGLRYGTTETNDISVFDLVTNVGNVLGQEKQEAGKMRKHWVYSSGGKCLVVVSIRKNMWGLVLVHENGRVEKGQYVGRHGFHHQHSSFDGKHFH